MSALAYPYTVSHSTLLDMAREAILEDVEGFSSFIELAGQEREPCEFFGPISTHALIAEILMKDKATDQQLAEGFRELRRRYLTDRAADVSKEFERLRAQCEEE